MNPADGQHGDRLERALATFLATTPTTPADIDRLLAANADLADLLGPMLGREPGGDTEPESARVLGDYRLVRELGRGGMGVVYEAWQRSLDRRVAVKVLAPGLLGSPAAVARFRREANAAGRLHHPNIVEVLGCGSESDQHFFAMQFVEGKPLHECLARFREPARAVAIATQLADALMHAHSHGVVHRDVKPANVLVRADDVALLTDFGVARDEALPSLTRDGSFLGTPDYASPEQVRGEGIDARSDVWSLGVVLHELLTGTRPFAAPTQEALLRSILMVEPPSLVGRPGISDDLAAIVGRALTKNRAYRYVSAAAMHADLVALARGETVSARLPTLFERTLRWARREPWQAVAIGALVAGLAAASSGFLLASHRADENERLAAAESLAKDGYAAKVREFNLLAGVVNHDRALERVAQLFPAWPKLAPALQAWLRDDCGELERLQPEIVRGVQALRAQALARTEAERLADRASHAQHAEWQVARRTLTWLEHQALVRSRAPGSEPVLPPDAAGLDAARLNDRAWARVAPQSNQRTVDEEVELGLAYARAAVAKAAGLADEHSYLDTLAWALAAGGRDAEAREASAAAMTRTPAAEAPGYAEVQRQLDAAMDDRDGDLSRARTREHELDVALDVQRTFRFADGPSQYLHDMLTSLLGKLDVLFAQQKPQVQARLQWATQLHAATFQHPNAPTTWAAARAAIAAADGIVASASYRGRPCPLADDDVVGLVPIGMNPVTRLWEFYELRSACEPGVDPSTVPIPRHDPDGNLPVGMATGIVFVLLPGGEFAMGAQAADSTAPNHDPEAPAFVGPVTKVKLTPFLCARHEITQAQWARLCVGDALERFPSGYPVGSLDYIGGKVTAAHPVERVSWNLATRVLGEHGMTLPTEAQWEYACRAGTTTPWWPGEDSADLEGAANVYDLAATRNALKREVHEEFDDGHNIHAPVGSYRGNPFGLFDLHGNVGEWCLDAPAINGVGFVDGNGSKRSTMRPDDRTYRGGSYQQQARPGRSSLWMFGPRETRAIDLGVRAVRRLAPR